jgi:hypothetical protein
MRGEVRCGRMRMDRWMCIFTSDDDDDDDDDVIPEYNIWWISKIGCR